MKGQIANLQAGNAEFRAVFNGPPTSILKTVFNLLSEDGGIEATLQSGEQVLVPVVLQMGEIGPDAVNPLVGQSGICNETHLLTLRNSPNCRIFVGLIPPGSHSNLSQTSTRSDFGLGAHSNSGAASTLDWWNDQFIQEIVDAGLSRTVWGSQAAFDEGKRLVRSAVFAADEVEQHDVSKQNAWNVLARLWAIENANLSFESMLSLVCGVCPVGDGALDADAQLQTLRSLAIRLENGFRPGIAQLKRNAPEDAIKLALDELLKHLAAKCETLTALGRSMPYFYGPLAGDQITPPPTWWQTLTLEVWALLLEEGPKRKEAIHIECTNSILSQTVGITPVAQAGIALKISAPESITSKIAIVVKRESGGIANQREWKLLLDGVCELHDESLPIHKSPIRYTVKLENAADFPTVKAGSLRVVSLERFAPGAVVCARTAKRTSLPKGLSQNKDRVALEATMALSGQGRHYVDIYVRSGVSIDEIAVGSDEQDIDKGGREARIAKVSDCEYGVEIEAAADCFYDFQLDFGSSDASFTGSQRLRTFFSGDETSPEECESEFERLITLNRQQSGGRGTADVQVNRQLRCSDLQAWMLAPENINASYYPLVLSSDYADDWRTRDWRSPADTIFSRGTFLNDPRPAPDEFIPPHAFLSYRAELSERIRGEDDNGLMESMRLGELAASDSLFCEMVDGYLRAYLEWLASSPDIAPWCDVSMVARFETDGQTLVQEPDALLVSPLHPIRLAWHCVAQRALFFAQRKHPCPAGSILDPDSIIDSLTLRLQTASGQTKEKLFFSVECSSDYWAILWNADRLERLSPRANEAPFDKEFGVLVGGISSGFSVAQVNRAMNDLSELLVAKPILNILLSSAAGQNNACNEGLMSWCRNRFADDSRELTSSVAMGKRLVQVLDDRRPSARPEDSEISNLAEDTGNAVRWFYGVPVGMTPDLGIIAQLETSSESHQPVSMGSALGIAGLIRHRIRQQLSGGRGAFLCESRTADIGPSSGDGLADRTMQAIAHIENMSSERTGYVFAPSVPVVQQVLARAEYASVSSSSIDPACFLGGWLPEAYLWDYDLPSYSSRAGDSNGYYLLSRVKEIDKDAIRQVLSTLPRCSNFGDDDLTAIITEISRRGIPTVRGITGGDSGASGDLGLFIASRLIQDEFRAGSEATSLLPVWTEVGGIARISLLIPVDPFKAYLADLSRAMKMANQQRPDLVVVSIALADSMVHCKVTPIEVKFRGSGAALSASASAGAIGQARAFSDLLRKLSERAEEPEMVLWKLAFQHLLVSIVSFGLRVYSQQTAVLKRAERWSEHHARFATALLAEELKLEIDPTGRLIVVDGSLLSSPRDVDGDGFKETIVLSHDDASRIVTGEATEIYAAIRAGVKEWNLYPTELLMTKSEPVSASSDLTPGLSGTQLPVNPAPAVKPTHSPVPGEGDAIQVKPGQSSPPDQKEVGVDGLKAAQIPIVQPPGVRVLIGESLDGFQSQTRTLCISDTSLNHMNMGVVGDLGTGKTQLLKSLILQIAGSKDANQGVKPRFLIFDYKRDYSSADFVQATGAKVIRPQHLPLNLFDIQSASESLTPWLERFKFFSDVLDKIYSNVGPVQRAKLRQAVRDAYEQCEGSGRQPNIYNIHQNYHKVLNGGADSISSILDDLVDMGLFTPINANIISFDEFLDGVVVISLDQLGQDDRTKNMLVVIMLNMFYEHMLQIPKRPYVGSTPSMRTIDSFLLVDEADSIMRYEFDVLRKVLLQGREFGVGVILASQYLRHFKAGATDYRDPLLTWFVHKVPNVTGQDLGALGLTGDVAMLAGRVKSLGLHQCLYKTAGVNGEFVSAVPFYQLIQK